MDGFYPGWRLYRYRRVETNGLVGVLVDGTVSRGGWGIAVLEVEREEMSGQVEAEYGGVGYRAEWSTSHSRGFGIFRYPENALEKIGFELCGEEENQYEFGRDPSRRKRSGLIRVHTRRNPRHRKYSRNNDWLVIALVCTAIGYVFGRSNKRTE